MTNQKLRQIIQQAGKDKVTELDLSGQQLTALLPEIGQLTQLKQLYLDGNQLKSLPPEIGQLTQLTRLELYNNQLTVLPPEIGQLKLLTMLELWGNQLISLPPEIGQLTKLIKLGLYNNQLKSLPPEIGKLNQLIVLELWENQLTSPPPEIINQGTAAILSYLQAQLQYKPQKQWVSKLIVVGEGGVGKTSLLRALRGKAFNSEESTTHGIEIQKLAVTHPSEVGVTMQLNTWDFGGQEIYHATHQFFLTNRALFLLAWQARQGIQAGKLYYWLDTLTALAPDSPILLVATHIDEREAELSLAELRRHYPQILGLCEISSKTGQGIEALRQSIAQAAAKLPLMGEIWPTTWLKLANGLRAKTAKYLSPQALRKLMTELGIENSKQPILIQWLHELGSILYFQDSQELNDFVILKPQWVSENISKVLESTEVITSGGLFSREEMNRIWHEVPANMREHFLRLMERFDLSYRDDEREISLVVERLPHNPPNYQPKWNQIKAVDNCKQIRMTFKLNTLPAGIPTWFIARAHRFSTSTHWRFGGLFAHDKHLALVQAFPRDNSLEITVRGPNPPNFFALLKDGIELTLARFPGLKIERKIPCLGHQNQSCSHEFNYEQLLKSFEKQRLTVECSEALEDVSVAELLYGWDWRTQNVVLSRLEQLDQGQQKILAGQNQLMDELKALRELTQREFTNAFHREQASIEAHCPNVFVLRPREGKKWLKAIKGQTLELQLYCQAPGYWHPSPENGKYEIQKPAQWLQTTAPYICKLVSVLRYAAPLIGPWLGTANSPSYEENFRHNIDLMKELSDKLLKLDDHVEAIESELMQGAALRALRHLLEEKDPQQQWGGLKQILTPEGHYLWLCEYHAKEYQ